MSVITSISRDHTELLGETLPEIAGEKAGIIKEGVPVVVALQVPEVEEVIGVDSAGAGLGDGERGPGVGVEGSWGTTTGGRAC